MPKDHVRKIFKQTRDLVERLHPDDDLDIDDIRGNLEAAGFDTAKLRIRLHEAASELTRACRRSGKPAPEYLKQVREATAPLEKLPSDPRKATDKMKGWIGSLGKPVWPASELKVARAYRKSGTVSESDRAKLDELEDKLKERAKRPDETEY